MAEPVYKFFRAKWTEAWYQLSQAEQDAHMAKIGQAFEKAGGKRIILCESGWASEPWQIWGVEEFPDSEAAQRYAALLAEINHTRYIEGETMLGTKWET